MVYDFSLGANGDVGAVSIQLTVGDFLPVGPIEVFDLTAPEVTAYSSGTPIDPTSSFIGVDITAATTLVGVFLSSLIGDVVLYTFEYPVDFFVIGRTPDQTGTFLSSAGIVRSDLSLATETPTATVMVSTVPEPATAALVGLGVLGVATWRRRRSIPA